jgi:hypothetical protein
MKTAFFTFSPAAITGAPGDYSIKPQILLTAFQSSPNILRKLPGMGRDNLLRLESTYVARRLPLSRQNPTGQLHAEVGREITKRFPLNTYPYRLTGGVVGVVGLTGGVVGVVGLTGGVVGVVGLTGGVVGVVGLAGCWVIFFTSFL